MYIYIYGKRFGKKSIKFIYIERDSDFIYIEREKQNPVRRGPAHNKPRRHYSKFPKFVLATGKHQKSLQKVNKI